MSDHSQISPMKEYVGLVWVGDRPGERFAVVAASLDEARAKVEEIYGEGHAMTLYCEEDANRPRR
jgi:hypothetical protein